MSMATTAVHLFVLLEPRSSLHQSNAVRLRSGCACPLYAAENLQRAATRLLYLVNPVPRLLLKVHMRFLQALHNALQAHEPEGELA